MPNFEFITDAVHRQRIIDDVKNTVNKHPIKVFTMTGLATCGKTTFEKFVDDNSPAFNVNIEITSAVKFTKQFATKYCGWMGGKSDIERRFLSDLKDTFERYCDFNRINLAKEIKDAALAGVSAIFIDSREYGDMKWLKENFNAQRVFLRKDSLSGQKHGNHSDDDLESFDYDIYVDNNGSLEDLEKTAIDFIKTYISDN